MIKIKDLHKYFGENHLLRGINFTISDKETLAIVGEAGSGKSTLLRCLGFIEQMDQGEIWYHEQLLTKEHKDIGVIYQHYNFFPKKTLLENVIEPPMIFQNVDETTAVNQAKVMLENFGLQEKAYLLPRHLTEVERQRSALVRLLMLSPKVIIWDEPTLVYEDDQLYMLQHVINQLKSDGITLLIVTANKPFAQLIADRILYLVDGRLVENI